MEKITFPYCFKQYTGRRCMPGKLIILPLVFRNLHIQKSVPFSERVFMKNAVIGLVARSIDVYALNNRGCFQLLRRANIDDSRQGLLYYLCVPLSGSSRQLETESESSARTGQIIKALQNCLKGEPSPQNTNWKRPTAKTHDTHTE